MNKPEITIFERVVLIGALPDILTSKLEPFPFQELSKFFIKHKYNHKLAARDQPVSFYQSLENKESIRYNDKKDDLTHIDQRNYSANKSAFFL